MHVVMLVVCKSGGRQFTRTPTFGGRSCSGALKASDCNACSTLIQSLFRGKVVKAFEAAAIEDNGGTETATNGAPSSRILRKWLARRWSGHLCRV